MDISNIKNEDNGFTLIELVIVIAGLATLMSFSIPNFLNSMKLNKIEEVKAIMNGYASDCLGKYRLSTNPVDFIENSSPDQLDNTKLSTLGYKIDGDKNKCSHLAVIPLNDKEKDLFAFDFRMSSDGQVLKTGIPSDNPNFLNSCRGWAGKNCGLSDAQKAEFARLAALAKAKAECLSNYNQFLSDKSTGTDFSWDNSNESCTLKVFAFEGIPVNSEEAIKKALDAKYGKACLEWRLTKRNSNAVSTNGEPDTKKPECGEGKFWFHSGKEFTSQSDWNEFDNQLKKQACQNDRSNKISQKKSGQYTYGPGTNPSPCGVTAWLCNGTEYTSNADYLNTSCGRPTNGGGGGGDNGGGGGGDRCRRFKPDALCDVIPSWKSWHPLCVCK